MNDTKENLWEIMKRGAKEAKESGNKSGGGNKRKVTSEKEKKMRDLTKRARKERNDNKPQDDTNSNSSKIKDYCKDVLRPDDIPYIMPETEERREGDNTGPVSG